MVRARLLNALQFGLNSDRCSFRPNLPVETCDRKLRKDTKLRTGFSGLLNRPQHRLGVGESGPFHAELSNGDS
jgi:hypothetical protein